MANEWYISKHNKKSDKTNDIVKFDEILKWNLLLETKSNFEILMVKWCVFLSQNFSYFLKQYMWNT